MTPQSDPRSSTPVLAIYLSGGASWVARLTEPVTTIGRSVDNVLEVPDPNMSRRHCVIEQREAGEAVLTDCNSSNGTKIHDERVISHELKTGDVFECGSSRFRYATSEADLAGLPPLYDLPSEVPTALPRHTPPGLPTPSPNDPLSPRASLVTARFPRLEPDPAPSQRPKAEAAVLAHERDDLRKLLEITKRLNQLHDLRRLLETIIDAAIELMAAERGFLILTQDEHMKIEIARNMAQSTIHDPSLRISTQICREVIDSGRAVLTTNAQADSRFGRYQSVANLRLRSIMCVPFRIKNETFGTVYLDAAHVGAFSERDVELLEAFSDQAALAIENARLLKTARARERIEQELRIASQIQRKLLPRKLPDAPGLSAYGWMHPAKEVGGDYYDFVPSQDGQSLFFCIGDVSGKGVPAGLVMASARSALRSLVERGVTSTREIVVSLNRLLCDDLDQEMFVSFVLFRYDQGHDTLHYTGAGHETILVHRGTTHQLDELRTGGMVLGLTTRLEAQIQEKTLELHPDDTLILYTDGVTETINDQREQFGLERLHLVAQQHATHPTPKQVLHEILSEVLRYKGRANQRDDITLLVVKRRPPDSTPPPEPAGEEPTRPR